MTSATNPAPAAPLTEPTEQGEQLLVAGVAPVDRFSARPANNPNPEPKE
jgi:hypothetical protein